MVQENLDFCSRLLIPFLKFLSSQPKRNRNLQELRQLTGIPVPLK